MENAVYTCRYTVYLVASLKSQVSFAKEPYKRDFILQKRPIILRSLVIVATQRLYIRVYILCIYMENA